MSQAINRRNLLIFAGLALLAVLLVVSPVWAVEISSGEEEVVIGSDDVIEDDLYVTASEIIVDGTIRGDLVAFGNTIAVNGTVEGDLIAAGQSVEIEGTVERAVPMLGPIVGLAVVLLGVGALVGWTWSRFRRSTAPALPTG